MNDGRMTRADHDACWGKWQEANEMIRSRRRELGDYHFEKYRGEAEDAIGTVEYDPRRAQEKVRTIQASMRGKVMSGEHFAEINRLLDKAWQRARAKLHQRYEEGQQRRREWEARVNDMIRKKLSLMHHAEETIGDMQDQIEHYRDLERDARSNDFAQAMNDKIEKRRDIIADKRSFIQELQRQIRELEDKLHS